MKLKIKCKALWIGDRCVLVDCEDYDRVSNYKWVIVKVKKWYYAVRGANGNDTVYMHRFILGCAEDKYVDHRNSDGLDNRRLNLRECSNSENQYNVDKKSNSSQKYKDIRVTKSGTYQVRMRTPCGRLTKTVKTEEEAVALYNEWAKKYHGEFARLIVMPSGASAKNTLKGIL